ncbi:MAG: DUF4446 family protein [Clostridium sp.]|nr:DUF4446 family protein [Clostridium sp.]
MSDLLEVLNSLQPYIIIGLSVLVIILLIMVIVALKSINRLEARYRKLTRGMNNKNLEEIIVGYLNNIDEFKDEAEKIKEYQNNLEEKIKKCVQKVSILRYKAFDDIGSDLSFSIALLDDKNDGIILTGIYGRNDSTVYAKPIDNGISRYDLSDEEIEVLEDALNKAYK